MKIRFLGTAAAEAIPAMFCVCEKCREAHRRGGKNIRTRTQALIDGKLLIDFPADTFVHCINNNINLADIEDCLITHMHADHFYSGDLNSIFPGYSQTPKRTPVFTFHGMYDAMLEIHSIVSGMNFEAEKYLGAKPMELYKPEKIGEHTVTALRATHDVASYPTMYIIENKEGKRLLYAHDTNYFCEEVWEFFEKSGIKLNFVSLDCTQANDPAMTYVGHMNLNDNIRVMNRLKEIGAADENTIFCSNHFSHNGADVLYEEFSEIAKKSGIITSYDGMEVEF